MRISDCSSDVCSSDLTHLSRLMNCGGIWPLLARRRHCGFGLVAVKAKNCRLSPLRISKVARPRQRLRFISLKVWHSKVTGFSLSTWTLRLHYLRCLECGTASCRERVCQNG